MQLTDPQTDPIVEILRLAYRRGLVVLQEQAKKGEHATFPPIDERTSEEGDNSNPSSTDERVGVTL